MINLGDTAKDTITGYKGVVIAETNWLNGCRRLTIQSKEMKDGRPIDTVTFDVEQLELVSKAKISISRPGGGTRENISRSKDPV
jgi:hypothetical protein